MPDRSSTDRPELLQVLLVSVAGTRYALETGHVDTVTEAPELSDVPHTSDTLAGVARVRGGVGVFLSARALLGAPPADADTAVQLDRDGDRTPVALLVDDAHDMDRVSVDRIVPADQAGVDGTVFAGAIRNEDGTVPLFGPRRLVDLAATAHS